MSAGETGETAQERDLMRLLRNARWETEACAGYAVDAEAAGDGRFATFFRDVQKTYAEVVERAEKMLVDGSGRVPAGVRPGSEPAQGDPGDVSPG